jgi:hypothetical protein
MNAYAKSISYMALKYTELSRNATCQGDTDCTKVLFKILPKVVHHFIKMVGMARPLCNSGHQYYFLSASALVVINIGRYLFSPYFTMPSIEEKALMILTVLLCLLNPNLLIQASNDGTCPLCGHRWAFAYWGAYYFVICCPFIFIIHCIDFFKNYVGRLYYPWILFHRTKEAVRK